MVDNIPNQENQDILKDFFENNLIITIMISKIIISCI